MAEKLRADSDGRFPCEYGCQPAPGEDPNKYRYRSPGGRGQHYFRAHAYASQSPKTIIRRKRHLDRRVLVPATTEFPRYSTDRRGRLTPGEMAKLRARLQYLVTGPLAVEFDRSPEALIDAIAELAKARLQQPTRSKVNAIDGLVLSAGPTSFSYAP